MRVFLDNREKDMEVIENNVSIFDVGDWPQYIEFNESIESCRKFCLKYTTKNSSIVGKYNRETSKISYQSHSSFLIKHAASINFASKSDSSFKTFK